MSEPHEIYLTPQERHLFETYTRKKPVTVHGEPGAHTVWLKVGVQSFQINDYCETAEHADWMRSMLAKALAGVDPLPSLDRRDK